MHVHVQTGADPGFLLEWDDDPGEGHLNKEI